SPGYFHVIRADTRRAIPDSCQPGFHARAGEPKFVEGQVVLDPRVFCRPKILTRPFHPIQIAEHVSQFDHRLDYRAAEGRPRAADSTPVHIDIQPSEVSGGYAPAGVAPVHDIECRVARLTSNANVPPQEVPVNKAPGHP